MSNSINLEQLLAEIKLIEEKVRNFQLYKLDVHDHNGENSVKIKISDLDSIAYGNMYNNTSTTITVSVADTWYEIASNFSSGVVKNVTFLDSHYLRILSYGTYMINYSIGMTTATANQEISGAIMINGVGKEESHAHSMVAAANKSLTVAGSVILTLNKYDQVSLAVLNHTLNTNIVVQHSNLSIHKIA